MIAEVVHVDGGATWAVVLWSIGSVCGIGSYFWLLFGDTDKRNKR